jgi:hypothetical protein
MIIDPLHFVFLFNEIHGLCGHQLDLLQKVFLF